MALTAVLRTMVLGLFSSGAGLLVSLYIVWVFGTGDFATFTIANAKLSIILLGLEMVPGQFSIFRMQSDREFANSISTYYLCFGLLAMFLAAASVESGIIAAQSWLLVPYAFLAVTQRYIELKTQASGIVPAFGRMPAISNLVRLVVLVILGLPAAARQPADVIWASLCIGTAFGQLYILTRFPQVHEALFRKSGIASMRHLFSVRSEYYAYIVNSVLKRAKDTFIPLVVDAAVPNRTIAGQVLIFFRASDAVGTQLRVLEMFLINQGVRSEFKKSARKLIFILSTVGLFATFILALILQYRQGIEPRHVLYAFMIGTVMFPYVLELIWRNEAYAAFAPQRVTASLIAFLIGISVPVSAAAAFSHVTTAVLIIGMLAGQSMSAATYYFWRKQKPLGSVAE